MTNEPGPSHTRQPNKTHRQCSLGTDISVTVMSVTDHRLPFRQDFGRRPSPPLHSSEYLSMPELKRQRTLKATKIEATDLKTSRRRGDAGEIHFGLLPSEA